MIKVNLMGKHLESQIAIIDKTITDSTAPETFEFLVEYSGSARKICQYAVVRSYKPYARKIDHYKYTVTVEVERVLKEGTLVDEAMAEIPKENRNAVPEYVGLT